MINDRLVTNPSFTPRTAARAAPRLTDWVRARSATASAPPSVTYGSIALTSGPLRVASVTFLLQLGEVGNDCGSVTGNIVHGVAAANHTVGIDEVADAFGIVGVLMPAGPHCLVPLAHSAIDIAEQPEWEVLCGGKGMVRLDGVERSSQHDTVERLQLLGAVTQALSFNRSTGGRRFRVPPQQHPVPHLIGQRNLVTVVVGQVEGGSNGSGRQHAVSLPRREQPTSRSVRGSGPRLAARQL